ncbi:MAG TPA: alpha/beta fold hydrolase [Vicinamibacterales bacterium]|nr:alpha/beta fold hydrolase [Vicinamibacterales bacterium]
MMQLPAFTLRLLVFLFVFSHSFSAAVPQLDGHWEGAIAQPAGELKMTVEFVRQGDIARGTFTLPAVGAFKWPLKITGDSPKVRFALPTGLAFDGELQGDTISGRVQSPTGGHVDPFLLKRTKAPAVPYTEEEVRFQSGGVTLVGTLRLPLTKEKHPAVFLLQGSGAVDREGESFYGDAFARAGIATLLYDKRGVGGSGGDFRQQSLADEASDALAGIHYLQGRREIDPGRVGLYGRSHGGIVAPLAASLSRDVAFIINVSGAGVPPYQQVTYQAAAQMRRDGFAEAEITEAVAYMHQKWDVARAGGAGWEQLQAATEAARGKRWLPRAQPASKLDDIVPSWKLQMSYDPMPAFEKVTCPVLAVFGELDTLTPVAETTRNLREGLQKAKNRNVTITVFPSADHALLVWPGQNDQTHWPTLAPGYVDTLINWLRTK